MESRGQCRVDVPFDFDRIARRTAADGTKLNFASARIWQWGAWLELIDDWLGQADDRLGQADDRLEQSGEPRAG